MEDNPLNQELALALLSQVGMQVKLAQHGQQALELLQQQDFDAVLMDCQMPVMDGYQATRAIRANPALKGLPVLAMTANAMVGDREKALEAGMVEHITKPIQAEVLYGALARWVKPRQENPAAESPAESMPASGLPEFPGWTRTPGSGAATAMRRFTCAYCNSFATLARGWQLNWQRRCSARTGRSCGF